MCPVLQFYVDHGQPVNEKGHIAPAVSVHGLFPGKLDLVYYFIH